VRAFGPLTVTVLSIAIVNIFKLYRAPANIKVVGTIPKVPPQPPFSVASTLKEDIPLLCFVACRLVAHSLGGSLPCGRHTDQKADFDSNSWYLVHVFCIA